MKRHLAIAVLLGLTTPLAFAASGGDKSVRRPVIGVFTKVSGTVTIFKVGKTEGKAVRVGYALREGDSAEIGPDGTVELMVKAKCKIVTARGKLKIKAADGDVTKDGGGELDHKAMSPCLSKLAAAPIAHDSSRVSGVIRMRPGKIKNAGPSKMKVCTTKPRISWCVAESVKEPSVRVRITGKDGAEVLDQTVADGTDLTWPDETGALTPGERYMVRYDVAGENGKRLGATRFSMIVASADELGVLEAQSESPILSAMYAEDFDCERDALDTYRTLSGDDPPEAVSERIELLEPGFACSKQ